jgi:hypothetical protein
MHLHLIHMWATTGGNECTQQILLARKGANSYFKHQIPLGQFKALSCMLGMPIGDNGQPYSCYDCCP